MSEAELKRSVRRGVALLLIPLSLLPVQVQTVTSQPHRVVDSTLPGISRVIGVVLVVAAVLYLLVSAAKQVHAAADTPF